MQTGSLQSRCKHEIPCSVHNLVNGTVNSKHSKRTTLGPMPPRRQQCPQFLLVGGDHLSGPDGVLLPFGAYAISKPRLGSGGYRCVAWVPSANPDSQAAVPITVRMPWGGGGGAQPLQDPVQPQGLTTHSFATWTHPAGHRLYCAVVRSLRWPLQSHPSWQVHPAGEPAALDIGSALGR
jgi:hypothetical protein